MLVFSELKRPRLPAGNERMVATLFGFVYLFIVFFALVKLQGGAEPNFIVPLVLAALPICAILAYRYPMVFPFGLYVALVPFDALLQVSGGGGATITRFAAIATAGAMIFHALLLRRAFVPQKAWLFWGAMTLYIGVSLLWTSDPTNGLNITGQVLQLFLFMTILSVYPATKTEFKVGLGSVVLCGVLAAGYAIQLYLSGKVSTDVASRVSLATDTGVQIDFNYFAASFILPISLAMYFTFYGKMLVVRFASGLATLALMAGLLVTGSRGAFVAAVAIFLYFAIRSKYRVQVAGFLAVVGGVTLLFPSVYIRFANDPSKQATSASGRTFIWQTGLHSLREHLIFGTGAGSYSNTYDRNFLDVYQAAFQGWDRPSHSILIGGITEYGIVGLAIILAAWFVSFRQLRVISPQNEWFGLRVAFEGAIVALFAMSLSIDPAFIKYIWLAHSMALMLLNQAFPRVLRLGRARALATRPPPPLAVVPRAAIRGRPSHGG